MIYRLNIQTDRGYVVVESDFRPDREACWQLVREVHATNKVPILPDGVRVRFTRTLGV
jgi:hypothetical protein